MAIKIGANLAYNGKLPNFERDSFETKAAMKAFDENSIDEGHLSYCEEDGNIYQYKHTNTVDTTTGRWRIFKTDIVVDAALNDTSKNPIQNKAVFEALKLKADSTALAAYQPKHKADYIAKANLNYSELPDGVKVVDLNGYTMFVDQAGTISKSYYNNGSIIIVAKNVDFDVVDMINIDIRGELLSSGYTISNATCYNCKVDSAIITQKGYFYNCHFTSATFREFNKCYYCTFDTCTIGDNYKALVAFSQFDNCDITDAGTIICSKIDDIIYINAKKEQNSGDIIEKNFVDDIDSNSTSSNAPQTKVVYKALQLKADKTQLNSLATKTELNDKADASALNSYLTKTDAGTTYATKDSLNNEVNQLVEEINLKLDDTVAASTYLRQDDANTTYAKKSDISNVYKFKGTKTNYADLPTTGVVTGDVWNITNADAEHGIKAGDNVAWNGTAWDNLSGVTDLSGYATTTTTDAMSADIKKLMNKAFPFTVKVSLDKTLAKKGTSQAVKVTITPKIGDDNVDADEIMINGAEYHGATPYVYPATATATTTYNVRVRKDDRTAQGSATITFVNPSYDGVVAANFTATEANIKALTETLRSGKGGTRTFNLNNQKACIAYPKAFGAATGIKDANGFDYLASYTRSELNVNGELYYVYLLTNATTITDMKQTIS